MDTFKTTQNKKSRGKKSDEGRAKTDSGSVSDSESSVMNTRGSMHSMADGDVETVSKFFRKRPRAQAEEGSSSGDEAASVSASKIPTSRRGKGRLPKVSWESGRGRGATAQLTAQRAVTDDASHSKVTNEESSASEQVIATGSFLEQKARFTEVVEAALKGVCLKRQRASKLRAHDSATASIMAAAEEANLFRPPSGDVTELQERVARLMADMEVLRKENAELRADLALLRGPSSEVVPPQAQPQPNLSTENQEVVRLVRQELAAFQARFSVLEGIVLRPPLASASVTTSYATAAAKPVTSGQASRKTATTLKTTSAKVKSSAAQAAKVPVAQEAQKSSTALPAANENVTEWQIAGQLKQRKKAEKSKTRREKRAAKRIAATLRTPKNAAVIMTLHPEAEKKGITYRDVLTKARAAVNLQELGIVDGLQVRVTATGARILEIPGTTSGPTADALADKLRASFNAEEVRVSRPTKCVEMRILGLDDSVSAEEVVAAIAKAGGCSVDQIRSGTIRPGFTGMGTAVISCPAVAAKKILESRKLLIGWVSAQVKLLEPKPLRCYRCQVGKHVGAKCTSEVDCSDRCFRCGQPGHMAGSCEAMPHCIHCAAAGKPAEHRAGSRACAASKGNTGKTKKGGKAPTTAATATASSAANEASREANMECQ